jgi:DNA helicase-2/ATP-dependent DNA helicase PcrA
MRQFVLSDDAVEGQKPHQDVLGGLNEAQRVAAETIHGPVMIVAGAGSGKTRTLTYRIAHILATQKARPFEILALTFTNKAAGEMIDRVVRLVGEDAAKGLWMGTFHSVFGRILRVEGHHLGYTSDYSIYDTDDTERVIRELIKRHHIDERQFTPRAVRSAISRAKNQLLGPGEYARQSSSFFEEKVAQVYAPYERELKQSNAMDFDDLLLNPIRLFDQFPDVLAKYQSRWKFIHIDEYQDTNRAQYVVTRQLSATHGNLCVVGDDAQSIYAFRGADITNILNFEGDYPQTTLVRLEQNYRSTAKILRLADSVIKHNTKQIEKTLWTENPEGEAVVVVEALSEKDEAQKLQRIVRDLQLRKGYSYGDFAVLYRTNAQSRSLEDALRRAGIPYEIIGGINFYQRKEIKDALAYLRLVVNPRDNESIRRVINYPTRGIGRKTVERLMDAARSGDGSLWTAIKQVETVGLASRATKAVAGFRDLIQRYGSMREDAPADELARTIIKETGILTNLRDENTIESLARWENVQELISAIAEFTANTDENATLSAFLQEVSLVTTVDMAEDDDNLVKLMTLHSSKGLEFPVVCVAGLEEGLFPLQNSMADPAELEEERRLLYVGVTRAREHLFLSWARSRFRFGQAHPAIPSRFIEEMDPSVLKTETGRPFGAETFFEDVGAPERGSVTYMRPTRRNVAAIEFTGPVDAPQRVASNPSDIVTGSRVEHQLFGPGKVIAIEGSGDQTRATVFFKRVGQKKLVLKFAKLRLID